MKGKLYIVSTPIGNLEDITLRALRVLKEVDLIACEDTRVTKKLLSHYRIQKPLTIYHEHNEKKKAEELLLLLEAGKNIAIVSDAGTPGVSDPGYRLIETLKDIFEILGDRQASISRELTKMFEENLRGKLSEVLETLSQRGKLKGEFTAVIEGSRNLRLSKSKAYKVALKVFKT